jgi:hypothetical protein
MYIKLSSSVSHQGLHHGIKKVIWNEHGYRQFGWLWLSVFCSVHGECLSTLQRWQPQRRFHDRWMFKTGFCQRDFTQTNEGGPYILQS